MNAQEAGYVMRAFGDGTRLRILHALSHKPLSVGELVGLLRCPQPRVSRHLRYLYARGLVFSQNKRNTVVYSLARPRHALHAAGLAAMEKSLADMDESGPDLRRLKGRDKP